MSRPTVLITGAAAGIGRAIAIRLVQRGARVLLWDISAPALEQTRDELGDLARAEVVDIADENAIASADMTTWRPTHLVNNAGILGQTRSWLDLEGAEIDRLLRINVTGPMLVTKAFLNARALDTPGAIVNMASIAGENGGAPGFAAYGASKGALLALTRAMARDLAPDLRVNALAPGIIQTAMQTGAPGGAANAEAIPLGRAGSAEEVAGAAEWLLLDAPYTSGEVLRVAGGRR